MTERQWTHDQLEHFGHVVVAAFKRNGSSGGYFEMAMRGLPEDLDIQELRPFVPAHIPLPTAPVLDPRYLGLQRLT